MDYEPNEIDENVLGDHAFELIPTHESARIAIVDELLDYEILVHLSGATTSHTVKMPDKMSELLSIVTDHPEYGPWRSNAQFIRDATYVALKDVQVRKNVSDPRLKQYIIENEIGRKLAAVRERMESLHRVATNLRALLLLQIEIGNPEAAKEQLIEFWKTVEEAPEKARGKYEALFYDVPVVKYVAFLCGSKLPRKLRPTKKEFETMAEADLGTDEGMPKVPERESTSAFSGPSVVDSPQSKQERKEYMRAYMKEYRAGQRRRTDS